MGVELRVNSVGRIIFVNIDEVSIPITVADLGAREIILTNESLTYRSSKIIEFLGYEFQILEEKIVMFAIVDSIKRLIKSLEIGFLFLEKAKIARGIKKTEREIVNFQV